MKSKITLLISILITLALGFSLIRSRAELFEVRNEKEAAIKILEGFTTKDLESCLLKSGRRWTVDEGKLVVPDGEIFVVGICSVVIKPKSNGTTVTIKRLEYK